MADSVFSASWYRISSLRPRLRRQARGVRHVYRGERWFVLQDLASGRFLRLDATAHRVVSLMDGSRTVEEIWQHVAGELGDDAPTQDDMLSLLAQLHQANLLLTDRPPDLEELKERQRKSRLAKLKQYIGNPLGVKVPVLDPDRALTWMVGLFPRWSGPVLLLGWALLVGSGIVLGAVHWSDLTGDITSRVFTAENLLLLWLVFPLLKAIHELGHGLAIKAYGGSCREMGLMFLVMVPVPYVDASSASAFPDKRQRMIVGLAGMMIEVAVASLALWLWVWSSPGVGKAVLHQVVIVAGVTTVLFNSNPLLRFDGYYVLADWLEIPNLGTRANRHVGYLVQRHLLRVTRGLTPPRLTPREGGWLVGYALLSFCYRMAMAAFIILLLAGQFFVLGVILAVWAGWMMVLKPAWGVIRHLFTDPVLESRRSRAIAMAGGGAAALAAFIAFVPLPSATVAEGVIWAPEEASVRAPHPCFGERVLARPGEWVQVGQPLLVCGDPELEARQRAVAARVTELEARLGSAQATDRVQSRLIEADLAFFRDLLADITARRDATVVKAASAGVFSMEAPSDFEGRWFERGSVMARVLDREAFSLLAVVPQGDVDLVRARTRSVELRTVDRIDHALPAEVVREVPEATRSLPSLALALQGGGRIGLDPEAGQQEARALVSLFQFEVRFAGSAVPETLGSRVYVRFAHPDEPIGSRAYRALRQLFLERFAA